MTSHHSYVPFGNRLDKVAKLFFFLEVLVKYLGKYYHFTIDDFTSNEIDLYSGIYNTLSKFSFSNYDLVSEVDVEFASRNLNNFDTYELAKYTWFCNFLRNRYRKKSRYYDKVDFLLNNFEVCYFCTFTFDDDHIDYDLKYKRKVLTQMLKKLNTCYFGNVDYGELHGREHFHVIIAESDIHICKANIPWSFGYYDIKVICNKDSVRLGSYIMKLVNHASKKTTKNSIITPRGKYSFKNLMNEVDL